jgi:chemotaxis protein MotB
MKTERETPIRIIVRRPPVQAHHGGAWKVAFADFMTSMMALFLVLWLVTQSSEVRAAVAGYFQDPMGRAKEFGTSVLPGQGAEAPRMKQVSTLPLVELRRQSLEQLAARIRGRLERLPDFTVLRRHIEITMSDDGLRITLLEDSAGVFFEVGSALPSRSGRDLLTALAAELGKVPNEIMIDGHTDARPYPASPGYSNWELSSDRGNAARRILLGGGLRESQVAQVRGFADRELRDAADPFSPKNRRVTITVLLDRGPAAAAADSALAALDSAVAGAAAGTPDSAAHRPAAAPPRTAGSSP